MEEEQLSSLPSIYREEMDDLKAYREQAKSALHWLKAERFLYHRGCLPHHRVPIFCTPQR